MFLPVYPECFGDTFMVKFLLEIERPVHQPSIGHVANAMKKNMKNRKAIGVIDNDKKLGPKYFSEFNIVEEEHQLILKKHKSEEHYLFLLNPALESWLLYVANQCQVDPAKYKLPSKAKVLGNKIKSRTVEKDQDFKQFLNTIKQKEPEPIKYFKRKIISLS